MIFSLPSRIVNGYLAFVVPSLCAEFGAYPSASSDPVVSIGESDSSGLDVNESPSKKFVCTSLFVISPSVFLRLSIQFSPLLTASTPKLSIFPSVHVELSAFSWFSFNMILCPSKFGRFVEFSALTIACASLSLPIAFRFC